MENFLALEPKTLKEAFQMMAEHKDARTFLMAGATDLIPPLRAKAIEADYLIDITQLGLNTITETEDSIIIGATCTMKQVYTNPLVLRYIPAVADACRSVGAVQTRGLATIGGNSCVALPSLDSAPPLFVYNADYILSSEGGERVVNVHDFFAGPRKTVLRKNEEILTAISVPKAADDFRASFCKFGRRAALTLSIVNCCLGAHIRDGRIYGASSCIGACAPTPVRIPALETYLEGKSFDEIDYAKVKGLVSEGIHPISDIRASSAYRSELAGSLIFKQIRYIFGVEEEEA